MGRRFKCLFVLIMCSINNDRVFGIAQISRFIGISHRIDNKRINSECKEILVFKMLTPLFIWMLIVHDRKKFVESNQSVQWLGIQKLFCSLST